MTLATLSKLIQLRRGDGASPEVFTAIPEITRISGPNLIAPQVETTSFDSTAVERIAGLPDNGELSFDANLVEQDTSYEALIADRDSGTLRNYRLTTIAGTTYLFSALVVNINHEFQVNSAKKYSCTLQISGAVVKT